MLYDKVDCGRVPKLERAVCSLQVLRGNPLVQAAPDQELNFGVKRRWDDDVVFKNQDRGAPKKQQRFINDTIRFVQLVCDASAGMSKRRDSKVARLPTC